MWPFTRKKAKIFFAFKGIRYADGFDLTNEDFISCLGMCKKMFSLDRMYTRKDIDAISGKLGFKFDEVYYFKQLPPTTGNAPDPETPIEITLPKISVRYFFDEPVNIPDTEELQNILSDAVSRGKAFTRSEIETLSSEIGCDVFHRCKWIQVILMTDDDGVCYINP